MNLATKLKILDLLESGEKIAAIARRFDVNESIIRSIRDNKNKIRESTSQLGSHAKFCKITSNGKIRINNNYARIMYHLLIYIVNV